MERRDRFCTAVNCMDGRVQEPVIRFLRERFDVENVDMVTEPGPNRILAEGDATPALKSIESRVRLSVECHGSVGIAVVGHYDCAGNPSPGEDQDRQTLEAARRIRGVFPGIPVIGLWVDRDRCVSELPVDTVDR